MTVADVVKNHTHFTTFARGAHRLPNGEHGPMGRIQFSRFHEYEQVVLNTSKVINFLVVDIDHDELPLDKLEQFPPAYILKTPHGHHLGWMVDSIDRHNVRAFNFFEACRHQLTTWLGGDPDFQNFSVRNPFYIDADVQWGTPVVHTLKGIREFFGTNWKLDFSALAKERSTRGSADSRNCRAFDMCLMEKRRNPQADAFKIVEEHNNHYNAGNLLPAHEVRSIARSIDKRTSRSYKVHPLTRSIFVEWGRKGGSRNSDAQQAQREAMTKANIDRKQSVLARVSTLLESHLGASDIAEMLGLSYAYVCKLIRELRGLVSLQQQKSLRAQEAWELQAEGSSAEEIALILGVSSRTVLRYLKPRKMEKKKSQEDSLSADTPVLQSSPCHKTPSKAKEEALTTLPTKTAMSSTTTVETTKEPKKEIETLKEHSRGFLKFEAVMKQFNIGA